MLSPSASLPMFQVAGLCFRPLLGLIFIPSTEQKGAVFLWGSDLAQTGEAIYPSRRAVPTGSLLPFQTK